MVELAAFGVSCTRLRGARAELRHAQQVVRGPDQVARELRLGQADETSLPQATDCLHPAEDLLDAPTLALTDDVTTVSRGPAVQPRGAATVDARDVRSDRASPEQAHEGLAV